MSKLIRLFVRFDARLKLRSKMLIAFIVILLIPSAIIGFFSYRKSSSVIAEQTSGAYLEALRQTSINISYRLTEVENISEIIYTNVQLQNILRRASRQELTIGDVIGDYKAIIEIIRNLEKSRNIFRIRLLVPNNPLYTTENYNIFPISPEETAKLDKELAAQPSAMEWRYLGTTNYIGNVQKSIVSLFRVMKDFEAVSQTLGFMAIDVDETTLTGVLEDMSLALPYRAMLYKGDSLVSTYARLPEQLSADNDELGQLVRQIPATEQGYRNIRLGRSNYLLLTQPVGNADWHLAVLVPAVSIASQSKSLGWYILLLSVSVVVLVLALSVLLSRTFTKRIHILGEKMKGIEQGHFGQVVEVSGNDEISLLQRRFNKMSVQIKSLIDEVYTITINKQREEMKVLEGRINSHFLYNTLDTVKWLALASKVPDIAHVVTNLSKFFRLSLNRGRETIAVEKELEHVRAYMEIQNIRFSGLIRYDARIQLELERVDIPKLILQPIVENAIVHGINKRPGKAGTIALRGRLRGEIAEFFIFDDGAGMSRETASSLLLAESPGYGLRNVHQRLQLAYGPGFGVKIRSKPGCGTAIRLRLLAAPPALPVQMEAQPKSVRSDT